MTLIGTLHNLSRSVGYALLAVTDGMLVVKFVGCEIGVFLVFKVVRKDFWYWLRVEGIAGFITAVCVRVLGKIIADFTGCLHLRHPFELGGTAYSVSMVWAQIMPFVALGWYEGGGKEQLGMLLQGSFGLWLALNGLFLCSIERSFVGTFFGMQTAPEYTKELWKRGGNDASKFDAAFDNRRSYINGIEDEVREWVAGGIAGWRANGEDWFNVEKIGDEFLPKELVEILGGGRRRNSLTLTMDIGTIGGRSNSNSPKSNRRHATSQVAPN